ncbi:hypothetical protein KDJ56_20995 [Brevibacillus composti]|uniref:Lipoprotein n=1 Tax=Brevibacillus composti TaxID=2796470 RepID=A0A7T5EKL9_9BACL|nr:hypothetical protein [Brevibacillus composti]QQE74283.1 hypothetical protein JD108_21060 [Brevibacillus composti]QUO41365.1 hypothetical protein KDJ56_20995 [Brevibacillus composti]
MNSKILYSILAFLVLVGCQSNEINNGPELTNTITDTDQTLVTFVHQKTNEKMGSKVEDFKVVKISYIEELAFGQIIFENNGDLFEGAFHAENSNGNWDVVNIEITQTDVKSPFTKLQVVGGLPGKESNFHIVSGIIHDNRIKSIQITYPNNESSIFIVDNNYKYYFDVKIGVNSFSTIVAYDSNYNEISSY